PPGKIPNFRATSTDTTIHVLWDAAPENVGIAAYQIQLDDNDWISLDGSARDYTFQNLQPDTPHGILIYAVDLVGLLGPTSSTGGIYTQKPPGGAGSGLKGEYFNNSDFTARAFARTDPNINFNW